MRLVAVMMLGLGFLAHGTLIVSAAAQVETCKRFQAVPATDLPNEGKTASSQTQVSSCQLVADRLVDGLQFHRPPASVAWFLQLAEAVPEWSPYGFERPPKVIGRSI
jgi:hypothetical protein